MPRLDNSDELIIDTYMLEFDPADPGKTEPVDLCDWCYNPWLDGELEIEHPSYEDDKYYCIECGLRLTKDDNWEELNV